MKGLVWEFPSHLRKVCFGKGISNAKLCYHFHHFDYILCSTTFNQCRSIRLDVRSIFFCPPRKISVGRGYSPLHSPLPPPPLPTGNGTTVPVVVMFTFLSLLQLYNLCHTIIIYYRGCIYTSSSCKIGFANGLIIFRTACGQYLVSLTP